MRRQPGALVALFAFCVLAGCGSGDDDSDTPPDTGPSPPPAASRGDLLQSPPAKLNSYSASDLLAALGGNGIVKRLISLAL